ncbi:MAG: nitrilase-related carbon-nitrogen hydrolase [Fibrobacterota bacterium]
MNISVVQCDVTCGSHGENRRIIADHISRIGSSDIILLPELCDSGYDMDIIAHSDPAETQKTLQYIQKTLQKMGSGASVFIGAAEYVKTHIYNTLFEVNAHGYRRAYRKSHLFAAEKKIFTEGQDIPVMEYSTWKIGFSLCFDIRFPLPFEIMRRKGAELILVSAAWPASRISQWEILLKARAVERQAYIAASNRYGRDGTVSLGGYSMIIDPRGKIISKCGEKKSHCSAEADHEYILRYRQEFNLAECEKKNLK